MHGWNEEVREHLYREVQGAEDIFFLVFTPSETSQAKAREFVARIFRRDQDREATPTLAVRDAQAEAITGWAFPT